MRASLVLAAALALAGCQREKSFDERYADAEKSIRATAAAIDKDLAEKLPSEAATDASPAASGSGSSPDRR